MVQIGQTSIFLARAETGLPADSQIQAKKEFETALRGTFSFGAHFMAKGILGKIDNFLTNGVTVRATIQIFSI